MNSRRSFLQSLAASPLLGAMGCKTVPSQNATSSSAASVSRPKRGKPKKIIHLVADGMSAGTLSCAQQFSELTRGRGLKWFELSQVDGAQVGYMDMRSQNSIVTDSSAASSVWGSGVRIPNGKVNQTSDGRSLATLYELFASEGWKRGLVTTTEITHATPAGFAASTPSRGDADVIAAQYLERKVDLLLGGGRKYFTHTDRKDKKDLLKEYQQNGYAVLKTPEDLKSAPLGQKWLGVFTSGHLPLDVDRFGGITKVSNTPSLAELTRSALRQFQSSSHFILQVEGGRVDHACHSMDAAGAMREMISFDEAVEVCLEFQKEHPDVLLVLTTDHGNGNPALNGMGSDYKDSSKLLRNILKVRQSIGEIASALKKAETVDEMQQFLYEITGYASSHERLEVLRPFLHGEGIPLYDSYKSDVAALSQVLANHLGMSFTSGSHTSDLVNLLAYGPSAEAFHGLITGPDIFFRYTEFGNIRFRNPQEPLQLSDTAPVHDCQGEA